MLQLIENKKYVWNRSRDFKNHKENLSLTGITKRGCGGNNYGVLVGTKGNKSYN